MKLPAMTGRLALIVGSRCDALQTLSFIDDYAAELHAALAAAGWRDDHAGLLMHPTATRFKAAVTDAFAHADESGSTLLLSFIGHGMARGGHNFYLMATDSSGDTPNSDNAFHLPQFINERLIDYPGLDGVVFLIDACQATEGVVGAAARWTDVLSANRGRLELLVASGAGAAYDGCFTKTMLTAFKSGREIAGDNLMCADIRPMISARCELAQTQHLSYSGGIVGGSDPGLWLVPNLARSGDAVSGRTASGLVDQLLAGLVVTDSVRENALRIAESGHARLTIAVGPAGSGKSTLLALFIRPRKAKALGIELGVADDYINAAVFLDTGATLESVVRELAAQLSSTVPAFAEATEALQRELTEEQRKVLDVWSLSIAMPLSRCRSAGRVRIIVDGLDQPEPGARDAIVAAVQQLTRAAPEAELGHVRVVTGVRSGAGVDTGEELSHAHRIEVTAPTAADLAQAATTRLGMTITQSDLTGLAAQLGSGGWLLARLVGEVGPTTTAPSVDAIVRARIEALVAEDPTGEVIRSLGILAAAGVGPVLPIALLGAALGAAAVVPPAARLHDVLVRLGSLVTRSNPGTARETVGIAHQSLLDAIVVAIPYPLMSAHTDIVDGYERHLSAEPGAVAAYWVNAAPRHYLDCGRPGEALDLLYSADSERRIDNRDRWGSWVPQFEARLGSRNHYTSQARMNHAHWRGMSGDWSGAATEYESLLADVLDTPDEPAWVEFAVRSHRASWRGRAGAPAAAVAELTALLEDQRRILGHDDPAILRTRTEIAFWRSSVGDTSGAVRELEGLVSEHRRIVGDDDIRTLRARQDLAHQRGVSGDLAGCIDEFEVLLADLRARPDSDRSFEFAVAEALAERRTKVGETDAAVTDLEQLLARQRMTLGEDHPDLLYTRQTLADARGRAGHPDTAVSELTLLSHDAGRALGTNDRRVFSIRDRLAYWKGETGDATAAIADFERLLTDQRAALGDDHTDVFVTRWRLATARGVAGDPAHAVTDLEALLADQVRVLGADHPDCLYTRMLLAHKRGIAGDPAAAVADLHALVTDMSRVLAEDHQDLVFARERLTFWQDITAEPT